MPKIKAKQRPRKPSWSNVLVGGLLRTIGTGRQQSKQDKEIQRRANLKLYKALKSQLRVDVLVGAVRTIKIKPLSKRRAEALRRLAESEHKPIKSKALFYTGRRESH